MAVTEKSKHGGKRDGAGRKRSQTRMTVISIRVTEEQKAAFIRAGGPDWIRSCLDGVISSKI